MIRGLFLTLLLIIALLIGAVVFTPLEFVLKHAGANQSGAGWASVEGNILKGRINGFYVRTQPVGDVRLELRPMSLLSGKATYDVTWSGVGGRGSGTVTASSGALELSEVRGQQLVQAIEGLAPQVRALGGEIRLSGGEARITREGCERGAGEVSTDTLGLAAAQYGKAFGELSGPISCVEGMFVVNMDGTGENGDRVTIAASASPLGATSFAATVTTMDSDLVFLLPRLGFERSGSDWQYINNSDGRVQ
ncbi:MAG: type II secretion system protein N [Pseudomonadota bacterium]